MSASSVSQDPRALIKHALRKIDELQGKLQAYEAKRHEPIAIVGMGCRIPGGADNPEAFWRLLHDGQDAITEIPADRWNAAAYYDANPDAPGKMSTRYGAFLERIDEFDAQFFGIAPREAVSMDPQQRILLEVAWEALEHANIPADRLYGSATGVFIGIIGQDYSQRVMHSAWLHRIDAYSGTGASLGMAAGRLSYCLGLTGPSLIVDTACSSSLVTLHLACDSLRRKECALALTGGVNLILEPALSINFSKARMLAPDGRCKTFDQAADGYARGEGCGVLVLKRLSDALQDDDRVLAVIRGSAVNQDGPSGGLTVPSGPAQEQVIRQALTNAGVSAEAVGYVEAHGTGTALGDPIELGALDRVFGATHSLANPLHIGSVKTNIGHLEAAAGVAGVIKLVLALQHECLPPHLHCSVPTPRFSWAEKPLRVLRERRIWPRGEKPRIAGISSFGFSGTNAHVVIEEAPTANDATLQSECNNDQPQLLTLSAHDRRALDAMATRYRDYLRNCPDVTPLELCQTAAMGRSHQQHRLAVVASSNAEFATGLDDFVQGTASSRVSVSKVERAKPPPLAFLFTGQGSQYSGMGQQLYRTHSVFRDALDRCEEILRPLCDIPLTELLFIAEPGRLNETGHTQPVLFCLEYALSELWRSMGVRPDAVMGHSVGEYAAACVAGVFSLEDGIKLIAARARLMQALHASGAMAAVFAPEADIVQALVGRADQLSIAALNGPGVVVVSGDRIALEQMLSEFRDKGTRYRELNVSHAFHSPLMEPVLAEFARVAAEVAFHEPVLLLVSNLTGGVVSDEVTRPDYWVRQIRDTVRFADGVATLRELGCRAFVEIGPDPVLLGMARQCLQGDAILIPSLRRADDAQFLKAVADIHVHGATLDWGALYQAHSRRSVTLPTYPFQRKRYWLSDTPDDRNTSAAATALAPLQQVPDAESLLRYFAANGELTAEEMQLLPKLAKLLVRQRPPTPASDQSSVCYRLAWREKAHTVETQHNARPDARRTGQWLVMASKGAIDLAPAMGAAGRHCASAVPGNAFARTGDNAWAIDPDNEGEYGRLLDEIMTDGALEGIVYVWPADLGLEQSSCGASEAHLMQVARLVRTLTRYKAPPRLWLVTQGATSAGQSSPTTPFPSLLWGMGRTLFLEHPALKGGLIDLSAEPGSDEMAALVQDLLRPDGEDGIALRDVQRYVARIEPSAPIASVLPRFKSDGAYLITGGLGALGLHVARLLAEHGAGAVVLVSRRDSSKAMPEALDALRKSGTRVIVAQGDCADESIVRQIIEQIAASGFTLKGVIHAAGLMRPRSMAELEREHLHDVLAPKLDGAWLLHRLTQHMPLDLFVCFSSVASVLGTTLQAPYTTANAFLDGLAEYRRGRGLPALSINWGPWQGGGLADGEAARRIADNGFNALPPYIAIDLLSRLLGSNDSRMIVVDADWPRLKSLYEVRGRQPLLERLGVPARQNQAASSAILDTLRKAAITDRQHVLVGFLQVQVSAVLHFDDDSTPDPRQGFFDMGLDSLTAVEFKGRIEAQLACSLPPSVVFDYPNITALAGFLLRQVLHDESPYDAKPVINPAPTHAPKQTTPQPDVRQLSDSQIAALIDDELATLVSEA